MGNIALHTGNSFAVARVRTVTNTHEHFLPPFTPNFTEALAGDCYTESFLFAQGKYLTPYSGPFWQLPRLSLYLDRPRRSFYTSFSLCSRRMNLREPRFSEPIDRMLHDPFRGGISIKSHRARVSSLRWRWDPRRRIRDTDSSKPLWWRRVKGE